MSVFEGGMGTQSPLKSLGLRGEEKPILQDKISGQDVGLQNSWMPHRNEVSHFGHVVVLE